MPRIVFAVLLLAVSLHCEGGGVPKDKAAVTPALREPTRFVQVSGMTGGLDVKLEIEYQTHDPQCRVTISKFAGAYSPRTYHHAIDLKREGERFTAKVPLDVVGETTCGWAPFSINYIVMVNGKPMRQPVPPSPLLWFRDGAPETLEPIGTTCRGAVCETEPGEHWLAFDAKRVQLDFARR